MPPKTDSVPLLEPESQDAELRSKHSRCLTRACLAYEDSLERLPLATKMVTSGVLYGLGDVIAQQIRSECCFDSERFLRAVAYGGIFYPPFAHAHFNFLEWLVVSQWVVPTKFVPWVKMGLEQFVYWSYFSNAYYHVVLGVLQGMSLRQVQRRLWGTLWDTLLAQWALWVPVQVLNFRFVPVRHQLGVVLVVSLVWTTFLSLAFPPAQ